MANWWDGLGYLGGSIAQSIAGAYSTNKQVQGQKDINEANIAYAREASERDKNLWFEQQQYNSPSSQMERLKEAGLNPNLVYGGGNVSGNVTSSAPQTNVAKLENPYAHYDISQFTNVLGAYMDYKMKESQIQVSNETANNLVQDRVNKGIQEYILSNERNRGSFYNQFMQSTDWEKMKAELKNTNERTSSVIAQRGLIPYQMESYNVQNDKARHEIKNIMLEAREKDWRYKNVLPRELASLNLAISGMGKTQREQDYRYEKLLPQELESMERSNFAKRMENEYNNEYSGYFHRYNSNMIEKFFGTALSNLFQSKQKIQGWVNERFSTPSQNRDFSKYK